MRLTYMNLSSAGHWLYAIGFLGLGILSFIFDDYAMNWQPVPPSFPAHDVLAYVSALLLSASGIGLLIQRTRVYAAVLLTAFICLWLLVLRLPPLVADFFSAINWLGFAETLEMMTGGWVLAATLIRLAPGSSVSPRLAWIAKPSSLKWAILLFGASLPLIGLSHFVYAKETAQMIPEWFPQRLALAYLTGAGHAAAGIAILLNVLPRLAAIMEACMMGCFVLFLHIPGVVAEPTSRFQWTMMFVAVSITGAAAIAANQLTQLTTQTKQSVSAPNAT